MPLFKCAKCGCVENTALGNYWGTYGDDHASATCSECHTGTWHGHFEKVKADPNVWHPELPHNPQFLRREPYDPAKHGHMPIAPPTLREIAKGLTPATVHHETRQLRRAAERKSLKILARGGNSIPDRCGSCGYTQKIAMRFVLEGKGN
jgi:hypothetical protein